MGPQEVGWGYGGAFVATLAAIAVLTPLCRRVGFLDRPSVRKDHGQAVPYSGGLALGLVLLPWLWFAGDELLPWPALAGLALCWLLGVADDARPLPSLLKFFAQLVAAAALAQALSTEIAVIGRELLPAGTSPIIVYGLAIFCAVGVLNALNMIDGSDGLAGVQVLAVLGGLVLFSEGAPSIGLGLAALVASAVAAYLIFNLPSPLRPYRIFMGDGGALLLAGLLVSIVVLFAGGGPGGSVESVAPWALLYLLCDTMAVLFARVSVGRYPFSPDRWHFHHLLLDRGLSMVQVAGLSGLIAVLGAGFGAALRAFGLTGVESFLGLLVVVTCYALAMARFLRARNPLAPWERMGHDASESKA
jgi:UDP-GlcNAc:undecaprenyl-phosphate GlcNAc-1-phosphate transferase